MPERPILLLDVLDTLVHDPFYHEVLEFFAMDLDSLFAIKDQRAWIEFELGRIDERALIDRYFTDGRELDLAGLRATLSASYRFLPGIEPLLAELRDAGVELHALSNYPVWYELIEARLGLSRYLQWSFVSCKTGVRKPDAQAYLGAAAGLGVAPERLVFVDDRAKNCAAAEAAGMVALQFTDAASLRAQLSRHIPNQINP